MRLLQYIFIGLVLSAGVAVAEDLPAFPKETKPDGGFMPSRTFNISDLESVSVTSGNLVFSLPLVNLPPGRAGLGGALSLTYNSSLWEISPWLAEDYIGPPGTPGNRIVSVNQLQTTDTSGDRGGWQFGFEYKLVYETKPNSSPFDIGDICLQPEAMRTNKLLAVFPDGSRHTLYLVGDKVSATGFSRYSPLGQNSFPSCSGGQTFAGPLSYHTTDGTFLQVHVNNNHATDWTQRTWTMIFPDGRRVEGKGEATEKIYDRNGNYITVAGIANLSNGNPIDVLTDQFGRKVTIQHYPAMSPDPAKDVITQVGYGGATNTKTWTISYDTVSLGGSGTTYVCANYQNDPQSATLNNCAFSTGLTVISSVDFPNAGSGTSKYVFDYADNNGGSNPKRYGMLNQVQLQVNSSPLYTANYGYDKDDQTLNTTLPAHYWQTRVDAKSVVHTPNHPGASSQTESTTYQYFDAAPYRTVVTAPDGGITTHYYRNDSPSGAEESKNSLVYRIDMPNGDSVRNYWQKNQAYHTVNETGVFADDQGNPYIRAEYRILSGGGSTSAVVNTYDKNGNILQKAEYDYGATMPSQTNATVSGEPTGTPTAGSPVRTTVNLPTTVLPADDSNDEPPNTSGGYWQAVSNPALPRILNAVERSEVRQGSATGTVYAVTELDYDSAGNPTNQRRWKSDAPSGSVGALGTGNSVETVTSYTSSGNVSQVIDPNGNITKFTYGALAGCPGSYTDLYVTRRQHAYGTAVEREFTLDYDCDTGLPIVQTDVDNGLTATFDYDDLGRPIETIEAGLREVHYVYDDALRTVTAKSDRLTKGDSGLVSVSHYDAFGRVALTRSNDPNPPSVSNPYADGSTSGIKAQARHFRGGGAPGYDLGSNPYRTATSDQTMGWTRTKYDTSGRVVEVGYFNGATAPGISSTPDTGTVTTSYSANTTTVADQAGVSRTNTTDALGRLVKVWEVGINSYTCYTYDVLDNLIQVRQNGGSGCTGGQLRTFTYDSLGRLRVAANPESGQIVYTYDDNGNLKTRSDDRGVVVTKYYDALNRLTSNEYSDGTPLVLFDYETTAAPQIGRLKKVYTVDIGDRRYTYDALGRITNSTQITGGQTYSFTYAYNLDDSVASITYPSSRVVAYDYDAAGRVLKAGLGTAASADYVSAAVYAAHGAASSMTLGNTLVETTGFNGRLQSTSIQAGSLLTLTFGYGTTNNNGNVRSQTIAGTGIPTFAQTYTYDGVNRLSTMSEASPSSLSRTYAYDAYGNRAVTGSQVGVGTPTSTGAFSASTNRMTSPAWADYDAAGNQLTARVSGARWSAAYDAENKQSYFCAGLITTCTATNADAAYVYDGEGNRVQKLETGETTTYVYDAFGRLAAEYSTSGAGETPGRYFRTTDHLGSTRLVTGSSMNVISRRDFFPFGEQILANATSGRNGLTEYNAGMGFPQLFTAKERDDESGLDYFLARYMSSAMGRFTSVDPENAGATRSDPQSWNGYAYVNNRPLVLTDPDGRCPNCATGAAGFGVGFVIGAGAETFRQAKEQFSKGGRIQLDGNKILASGVGTGIFGAAVGFTGGLSLAAVGVGGAAGVAGGVVERSIDSDSSTAPVSAGDVKADAISGVGGVLIPGAVVKSFGSLPTAAAAKGAAIQAGEAAAEATASVFPSLAPAAGREAARQSAVVVSGVESATKQVVSQPVRQFVNSEAERLRKKEEGQ